MTTSLTTSTTSIPGYWAPRAAAPAGITTLSALALGAFLFTSAGALASPAGVAPVQTPRPIMLQQREGAQRTSIGDSIIADLGRLIDGWAGQGSVAPSAALLGDVAQVLSALPLSSDIAPAVHVDDDGSTALLWTLSSGSLLSLEFFGKGYVAATLADKDPEQSRFARLPVGDDVAIVRFIEEAGLQTA